MSKTVVTNFPEGLGKPGHPHSGDPISFTLEYKSIEGYAADLRYALSKYDISDEVLVDITTVTPVSGTVVLAKGKEGSGTYEIYK